ncbi:MAG TPA: hypothetical protein VHT52_05300 [Stellaceae bacterium]|nr:hypothetical protein [Stellaceae bacterium]
MVRCKGLVLAHLWVAFGAFGAATALGVWQMWVRSSLHAPYADPQNYFLSVTAHGTSMAYVPTTFSRWGLAISSPRRHCYARCRECSGLGSGFCWPSLAR